MILVLQFVPAPFLTNLRNHIGFPLPGSPVPLEGKIVYLDGYDLEKTTTIATAAPDPKNTRGVPTIDNQNQKHPTANLDAVIHIAQPVTVHYYTFDQLYKAPGQGTDPGPTTNVAYDLNLELAVDLSGGPPAILLSFLSVTRQGKEVPDVEAEIAPFFPPTSVPIDFASLSYFLSDPNNPNNLGLSNYTRGGISVSTAGMPTLAFELENPSVGPSPSAFWDWTAFNMPGPFLDLLQGSAFGVALDGRIVADILAGLAYTGLKDKIDQNEIKLNSSPSGFWIGDRALVTFSGDVIDACVFLFFTHDVGFDATVQLIPLVPKENTLRLDVTADYNTNAWDDFVCALSSASFPLNVANLLEQNQLDPGVAAAISLAHFFGGLPGFITIFNATLVEIGKMDPLADYKKQHPNLTVPPSTTHNSEIYIDQELKLPNLQVGNPFLEKVAAHPLGPILQGKFSPLPQDYPNTPLDLTITPLTWSSLQECILDPAIVGEIDTNTYVINAQVIEDPLPQFSPFLQNQDAFVTISIPQASLLPAYLANPYPCRILLFTGLGVRIIDLGVCPPISDAVIKHLKDLILLNPHCGGTGSTLVAGGKWQLDWLGDPGPEAFETRIWTLGVSSLSTDNVLTVRDAVGQSLATANTFGNQAQASVLTTFLNTPVAAARSESLTLERRGAPLQLRPGERIIRVTQTALTPLVQLVLDDACLSLEIAAEREVLLAVGVLPAGLYVWSLRPRKSPRLRFQLARPGLVGALLRDGRYIIWGQDGIFSVPAPDPRWSSSIVRSLSGPILKVIPAGSDFLALSPNKLIRLDPQLRPVGELAVAECLDMAPAGRFAIIAGKTNLTLVDATVPVLSAAHAITRAVSAVGRARVSGHSSAFYALEAGGAHSILEFTAGGQIQTLNTYAVEPWFVNSRTLGSTLVRLSPFRGILTVHQVRKVLRYQT